MRRGKESQCASVSLSSGKTLRAFRDDFHTFRNDFHAFRDNFHAFTDNFHPFNENFHIRATGWGGSKRGI